jgi:hypothetical protein
MITVIIIDTLSGEEALNGVSLRVIPAEELTIAGDPVVVVLNITNRSVSPVSFVKPEIVAVGESYIQFFITELGKKDFRRVKDPYMGIRPCKVISPPNVLPVITIAPGENINFSYCLGYDIQEYPYPRWLFPTSGKYVIKAEIRRLEQSFAGRSFVDSKTPWQIIESSTGVVTIVESKNKMDNEAFARLQKMREGRYLYCYDVYLESDEEREAITKFLEEFRESRFAMSGKIYNLRVNFAENMILGRDTTLEPIIIQCGQIADDCTLSMGWRFIANELRTRMVELKERVVHR